MTKDLQRFFKTKLKIKLLKIKLSLLLFFTGLIALFMASNVLICQMQQDMRVKSALTNGTYT